MTAWVTQLADALAANHPAILVTVAHTAGSTPREAGTAMIVTAATLRGSIGGGHLEMEALRIARGALEHPGTPASTWIVRFPLAARLGQCCGGVATLAFTALAHGAPAWLEAAVACVRTATPFALVTRIGGASRAPSKLLVTLDDTHGSLADRGCDAAIAAARAWLATGTAGAGFVGRPAEDAVQWLIEVVRPDAFPVLVFGNGHVGRALVRVLATLPASVQWIDSREADFPASIPDNVEIVVTDAPEDEIARAPHGAFVVVLTHSHALDFAIVEAALARDDWRYLGLIGSHAKRAQFERRLVARGMTAATVARVVCPIGMRDGFSIRSKEPGAIAIATAAELIATRDALRDAAHGAGLSHRAGQTEARNGSRR